MAKSLIGIEILGNDVCFTQIIDGKPNIAYERLPENLIVDNKFRGVETLSTTLAEIKKKYRFVGKDCAVVLPESSTFFRTVNMPAISAEQMKLNLRYEFRDYVGSEAAEYNYDYAVQKTEVNDAGRPITLTIAAGAGRKSTMDEYDEVLKRAGMRLKAALPREMTLINILNAKQKSGTPFIKDEKENRFRALIDICVDHTRIYIFQGNEIVANKMIEIGLSNVDRAIAAALNVDQYLAALYRDTNYENVLDLKNCHDVYAAIGLEIMKVTNFFSYENNESVFEDVYFSGAGASIAPLIDEILSGVRFEKHDARELLPESCASDPLAARCALAIGLII